MSSILRASFPRVRGDVPINELGHMLIPGFSPRARGCSAWGHRRYAALAVFPACAGMFHCACFRYRTENRFPRVRGDVPPGPVFSKTSSGFSPRARGCSAVAPLLPELAKVFPACAGMFLIRFSILTDFGCFPRVRGDVPGEKVAHARAASFSPRTRGCSV